MNLLEIKKRLEFHEGFRAKPYLCSQGKRTIGIGRNLEAKPFTEAERLVIKNPENITKQEAYFLLENDIKEVIMLLYNMVRCFSKLDDERKYALIDMGFQMGVSGVCKFKNMLAAMDAGDFEKASKECLNSAYAKQTPARARRIARLIQTGKWKI
jgi:lysozyme